MWNPFASQADATDVSSDIPGVPGQAPFAESPISRTLHSEIAEIELMSNVAIATFTITELTMDEGVEKLANLLVDLRETGAKHFVLDIQNIQFMDSMCLGCLVESLNAMAGHGGKIALVNTAGSVQSLFRMTRLDRVFPICRDVMHAINAVQRVSGEEE